MSARPAISIIMANYNGAKFLRAAIESVTAQTLTDWQLIFVDDASKDDSVDVANAAAARDPRIRILRQPVNRGPGAARNRALAEIAGDWVAILDSDDLMAPDRLERLLARAAADNAAIAADNLLLFSDESEQAHPFLPPRFARAPRWIGLGEFVDSGRLYSRTPDLGYLKPMIRADLVRETAARYDESLRIGEDFHFLVNFLAQGQKIRYEPAALYLYRKHPGSVSHRMRKADLSALLAAEHRLQARIHGQDARERAALRRRRQSLETLIIYEDAIGALKAGEPGRGARVALRNPRIWPLLTRPLQSRLKRLAEPYLHARRTVQEGAVPISAAPRSAAD